MAMALPLALHLLAAVIWVGGMFYAYMAMRPAVGAVIDRPGGRVCGRKPWAVSSSGCGRRWHCCWPPASA